MLKKNKYQNWSKEELIREIEGLKNNRKYRIVWEEKKEDVVKQCKMNYPF